MHVLLASWTGGVGTASAAVDAVTGSFAAGDLLGVVTVLAGTVLLVEVGRRRFGRRAAVPDGGRPRGHGDRSGPGSGVASPDRGREHVSAASDAGRHGRADDGPHGSEGIGGEGTAAGRPDPEDGSSNGDAAGPTDERERVTGLLDDADGQLPQSEIVEGTHWSKAKVSRLLTKMDEDGDVVKIRLGRENLICLPRSVPEIAADD